jgi:di/tricarboxylate transporter
MTDEYIALAVILAGAMYLFWTAKLRTDLTALLVMLTLIVPWPHLDGRWRGILTYKEGFSGFGSAAVVMVAAMFIFGAAMVRTGIVEFLGGRLFKACAHHELLLQFAVLAVATAFSMFVNDTTVVLVFLPIIMSVCKEKNLSPSRYLMAVAYGSLLGGQWTLIGTRSNIVISDYLLQKSGAGLGFFDFTAVAAVVFAACAGYFLLVGRRFLPKVSKTKLVEENQATHYLTEALVTSESGTVGKRLDELSWQTRSDVSVLEVIRGKDRMPPHGWVRLQAGDVLVMQGPASTMSELLKSPDFELQPESEIAEETLQSVDLVMVEAVLAPDSDYAGYTLEEVDFRRQFGFAVMGIARHGKTIRERPMATRLRFGDSLLLLGHVSGAERLKRNPNLILLDQQLFPKLGKDKALIILTLLLGMIGSAVSGLLSPAISVPLAAMLAILFRCVRVPQLYHAVDWQSVVTVAGMIPFGLALEKSGAAAAVAHMIGHTLSPHGPMVMLGSILLLAVALTQLIENAAVAIILAPIAYQVSIHAGVNPKPFLVGLAICVSAAFCTPVAHESTILVMGPGRYRFKHYLQIGGPMAFLTWLLATLITPLVWPFR